MTANCLRTIKLNLHPKLALIQGRRSTSHAGLPKSHSSFLNEFLDNRISWPVERTNHFSCLAPDIFTNSRLGVITVGSSHNISPLGESHTYDPLLHAVVKPLAVTSDDIVLGNNVDNYNHSYLSNSTFTSLKNQIIEDDMQRDVIQRENFSVTVLSAIQPMATHSVKSVFEKRPVLSSTQISKEQKSAKDPTSKPTDEQLEAVYLNLSNTLPKFFTQTQDYRIIDSRIVFENNIRGITTYGLNQYIQQMSLLRFVGHLKFAYVKMDILKLTKHTEDGTIRVRWRIKGVSTLRAMFQFWKFRSWKHDPSKEIVWYDGFSTFYVGGDGLIHRHVCDKMMPDEHKEKVTPVMAAKLALLMGFRPAFDSLGSFTLSLFKYYDDELNLPNNAK